MDLKEILLGGGGVLLVLMTLVQVTPVKVNPWSALARMAGRAINGEVLKKLDSVEKRMESHITADDRRTADGNRTRILHFNNELLRGNLHTKEEYLEVVAEIDAYERYCSEHPEYPNNRAVLAIENIKSSYRERLQKHDFLQQ